MARPRVFISSTYYDLRVIRADLARFAKELGYEAVLFERGNVPYGKDEALEEYCYREIASCDIVVNIIGAKFGSRSRSGDYSVTQKELKKALDDGKQVYVFVERGVLSEYHTWLGNKSVAGFQPMAVNDVKIYQFLEEIYSLPSGNPIEGFETSDDVIRFLREQWSGLFQRLLQEQSRQKELSVVESLQSTAATLNNLVTFLTEERSKGEGAIKDILLSSHPAFAAVKKAAQITYRVVFHTLKELDALLSARGYEKDGNVTENHEWDNEKLKKGIRVSPEIFDDFGNLKILKPEDWKKDFVGTYSYDPPSESDDIPF